MAKLSRIDKLKNRGIIWFEVDDVFAHLTAAQSQAQRNSDIQMPVRKLIALTASAAGVIRERMRSRGETSTGAIALKKKGRGKPVGFVTGGMWQGLQSRGTGKDGSVIAFSGQSKSQPSFHDMRIARLTAKGRNWRASTLDNERNDRKASFVYYRTGINVIEPNAREIASMAEAIGSVWGQQVWASLRGPGAAGTPAGMLASIAQADSGLVARFKAAAAA